MHDSVKALGPQSKVKGLDCTKETHFHFPISLSLLLSSFMLEMSSQLLSPSFSQLRKVSKITPSLIRIAV